MRSWTTFIVFGVILVVLLVVYALTQYTTATDPVIQTAQQFLSSVHDKHAKETQAFLDPSVTKMVAAGETVMSISFDEAMPFNAAFQRLPAVTWNYLELTDLQVDTSIPPHFERDLATVRLKNEEMIFFRREKKTWKIIYITKPRSNS